MPLPLLALGYAVGAMVASLITVGCVEAMIKNRSQIPAQTNGLPKKADIISNKHKLTEGWNKNVGEHIILGRMSGQELEDYIAGREHICIYSCEGYCSRKKYPWMYENIPAKYGIDSKGSPLSESKYFYMQLRQRKEEEERQQKEKRDRESLAWRKMQERIEEERELQQAKKWKRDRANVKLVEEYRSSKEKYKNEPK